MTAPGDSVVIIVLVAVFVACSGYAAGRLHQRYQLERDREEAYRDGYDTATRSVFSLAARVIAPRRAARGAAPAPRVARPAPVTPSPPAAPVPELPVAPRPASAALPIAPPPGPVASTLSSGPPPVPSAGSGDRDEVAPFSFPVPPKPSPRIVAEAAAVGGVVYQPFPDPRHGEIDDPVPAADPPLPPTGPPLPPAGPPLPPAGPPLPPTGAEGRHTVPDELVQANTYRLPPDRIFRARVPDAANGPGLPEEPTTRLSPVPKPRQS